MFQLDWQPVPHFHLLLDGSSLNDQVKIFLPNPGYGPRKFWCWRLWWLRQLFWMHLQVENWHGWMGIAVFDQSLVFQGSCLHTISLFREYKQQSCMMKPLLMLLYTIHKWHKISIPSSMPLPVVQDICEGERNLRLTHSSITSLTEYNCMSYQVSCIGSHFIQNCNWPQWW